MQTVCIKAFAPIRASIYVGEPMRNGNCGTLGGCNCPHLVRRLFNMDQRIASRLTLAHQHERSPWLGRTNRPAYAGEQLAFSF